MLPDPALSALIEYIDDTRMGVFINLSQVNRASRRFFLSDYAWQRFDVHQVHGEHHVYTYGDYKHEGIAAHYYNWLCALPDYRRQWHMPFSDPSVGFARELYDQLNYLTRVAEFLKVKRLSVDWQLLRLDQQVWRCWLLHPLPEKCDWYIDLESLSPLFNDKARYTKIACCVCITYPYRGLDIYRNPYQDDREVSMQLVQRGQWGITPIHFQKDEDFMLEALCRSSLSCGLYVRDKSSLFNRLYERNFDMAVRYATRGYICYFKGSEEILHSEKFMLECVKYEVGCLSSAGELCDNVAVMSAAIRTEPFALRYARKLRDNKDIVYLAVSKDPHALKWASRRLRDDVELVEVCTERDPTTIEYASSRVKQYLEIKAWCKRWSE